MKQCQFPECTFNAFSHNYCQRHQFARTDEKWLQSIIKSKEKFKKHYCKIQKSSQKTGEKEMFEGIWATSPHVSFLTGENLDRFYGTKLFVNLFHHILNKKNYPNFRLNEDNVIILSPQEHLDIHSLSKEKLFEKYSDIEKYFSLWDKLKSEYQ